MTAGRSAEDEAASPRNFFILSLYLILHRIGWIFKTESVVIPAFLDHLGGTAWLRGCLPMLNRLGEGIPPVLLARRLKVLPCKKWALVASALGQSFPFLAIAATWFLTDGEATAWLPWAFMVFYGLFFVATGIHNNVVHTLSGKLVRVTRRGRLVTVSLTIGCPASILVACLLMGRWLELPDRGFGYIFGFTGLVFFLVAGLAALLAEPADAYSERANGFLHHFRAAIQLLRNDRNFRRLGIVAALFGTVLMLFPHYQAMGRTYLDLDLSNLLLWVAVQNAGTGAAALVAGPLADRYGNRLVVRTIICCCACPPLLAVVLGAFYPAVGRNLFWMVFVLIGLTPVAIKILANYTLEIADKAEHPRAISTMYLCFATPIMLFSPLVGLAVSLTNFEVVFTGGAICILGSGVLTFGLREPREH